ncbi:hypothetical protein HMI56_000851 [Coelomomyces lativittatus]|nr:hypothetical protein HMI56_000851 [Coelomomyces lativittatus]
MFKIEIKYQKIHTLSDRFQKKKNLKKKKKKLTFFNLDMVTSLAHSSQPSLSSLSFQEDYSIESSLWDWSDNSLFPPSSITDLVLLADEFFFSEDVPLTTKSTSSKRSASFSNGSTFPQTQSCTSSVSSSSSSSSLLSSSSSSATSSTPTTTATTSASSSFTSSSTSSSSLSSFLDEVDTLSTSWWHTTTSLTDLNAQPFSQTHSSSTATANTTSSCTYSPYLSCSSYSDLQTDFHTLDDTIWGKSDLFNSELDFDVPIRPRKVSLSAIWCDSSCVKHGRKRKFSHISSFHTSSSPSSSYSAHAWSDPKLPLLSGTNTLDVSSSSSSASSSTFSSLAPNFLFGLKKSKYNAHPSASTSSFTSSIPSKLSSVTTLDDSEVENKELNSSSLSNPSSYLYLSTFFTPPSLDESPTTEVETTYPTTNNESATCLLSSTNSILPTTSSSMFPSEDPLLPHLPKDSLLLSSEITKDALMNSFALNVHQEEEIIPPICYSTTPHPMLSQFPLIAPSQPLPKGSPSVFLTLIESTPVYLCVIPKKETSTNEQGPSSDTLCQSKKKVSSSHTLKRTSTTSSQKKLKTSETNASEDVAPPMYFLLRRADTHYVNASTLLVAGGIESEHERSIVLSLENARMNVPEKTCAVPSELSSPSPSMALPVSTLSLAGTWIPLERARALATTCNVETQLALFLCDLLPTLFLYYSPDTLMSSTMVTTPISNTVSNATDSNESSKTMKSPYTTKNNKKERASENASPSTPTFLTEASFEQEMKKTTHLNTITVKLPPAALMRPSYPGFVPNQRPSIVNSMASHPQPSHVNLTPLQRSCSLPTTSSSSMSMLSSNLSSSFYEASASVSPISVTSTYSTSSMSATTSASELDTENDEIDPMATESEDDEPMMTNLTSNTSTITAFTSPSTSSTIRFFSSPFLASPKAMRRSKDLPSTFSSLSFVNSALPSLSPTAPATTTSTLTTSTLGSSLPTSSSSSTSHAYVFTPPASSLTHHEEKDLTSINLEFTSPCVKSKPYTRKGSPYTKANLVSSTPSSSLSTFHPHSNSNSKKKKLVSSKAMTPSSSSSSNAKLSTKLRKKKSNPTQTKTALMKKEVIEENILVDILGDDETEVEDLV